MNSNARHSLGTRRAFMQNGVLVLTTAATTRVLGGDESRDVLTVGLMTDLHYADKPTKGTRYYRESLGKLGEAIAELRRVKPDFVVELGDLIDAADSVQTELGYLNRINGVFAGAAESRHYVLGNHCVTTLTKREFLAGVGQAESYYSFDRGGYHFVVLDACFTSEHQPYGRNNFVWTDANIPPAELDWLKEDLHQNSKPTVVFAHQRLDVSNNHGVRNAPQVREILESAGEVVAVFQGHSHKNDHRLINDIHYCTLRAMVEGSGEANSGYAIAKFEKEGTIRIEGFRDQASLDMDSA